MKTYRILIVEDDLLIARLIAKLLKAKGYEVCKIVSSGQAAISWVVDNLDQPPDLILMDIILKGDVDGIETAKEIDERFDIPIIFVTGNSDSSTLERVVNSSQYGYILKPFKQEQVDTTIKLVLKKKQEIDQLSQEKKDLLYISSHDPLTGLGNRRYFDSFIDKERKQSERYGYDFSVIMMDIDFFKKCNDTYGHDAGDFILKQIAQLLQNSVRSSDSVFRYGGEEMIIVMPQCPLQDAEHVAESIRILISKLELFYQSKMLGHVTSSFGVASFPQNGTSVEELIKAADEALYRAKNLGRNRVVISSSEAFR